MHKRNLAVALATVVLISAIGRMAGWTPTVDAPSNDSGDSGQGPAATSEAAMSDRSPVTGSEPSGEQPLPVRAAIELMAQEFGIEVDAIQVLSVEPITWPDGSLGCPKPGMMYTQMLTDGFRVRLAGGAEEAEYHTDQSTNAVRCEEVSPFDPGGALAPTE
jgi:hypothetical protein